MCPHKTKISHYFTVMDPIRIPQMYHFLIYTIKVTIWSSITCWFENWKYVASLIFLIYCIFIPNLLQNWKMYYINKNTIIWEKWCDRARKSSTCAKQWNSISLKKILQMSIKLKGTFSPGAIISFTALPAVGGPQPFGRPSAIWVPGARKRWGRQGTGGGWWEGNLETTSKVISPQWRLVWIVI